MEEIVFNKKYITCPAAYPRNNPMATMHPQDQLVIQVAIYTPKDLSEPLKSAPTLVYFAGNGFPKEACIPFFEALYLQSKDNGIQFNGIISLEAPNQGVSNIANEKNLGDTYEWYDGPKDIISCLDYLRFNNNPLVINGPLIGMGHSFGGNIIFSLASQYKRLFSLVIGLDAIIIPREYAYDLRDGYGSLSYRRRDIWKDFQEVREDFSKKPSFSNFNKRAFEIFLKYAFRPLPTFIYPKEKGITLSTDKHQETYVYCQENKGNSEQPFKREEAYEVFDQLKQVECPMLLILAESSFLIHLKNYGSNIKATDQIKIVPGTHLIPYEESERLSAACIPFLKEWYNQWLKNYAKDINTARSRLINENWISKMRSPRL